MNILTGHNRQPSQTKTKFLILGAALAGLLLPACGDDTPAPIDKRAAMLNPVKTANETRSTVLTFGDEDRYNDVYAACDGRTRVMTDANTLLVMAESEACRGMEQAPVQALITFDDTDDYNDVVAECDGATRVYRLRYSNKLGSVATVANSQNC